MYEFTYLSDKTCLADLHRDVWRHFEDMDRRPFLYRADASELGSLVHVRSEVRPNSIPGMLYRPEVNVRPGQRMQFDLRTVPIIRAGNKEKMLKGREIVPWLREKVVGNGIEIVFADYRGCWSYLDRGSSGKSVPVHDVIVTGELKIVHAGLFFRTLLDGIGRYRAFGFGMLRCWAANPGLT